MMAYSMSASHTSTHVNSHTPKHTRTYNPLTTLPMNAHRNWNHTSVLQNSWWCRTGLFWVFMCQHSTAHSTTPPPHTHKHRHSMLNLSPDYNLNLILLHIPCLSIKNGKTKDLSVWSGLKSAVESTQYTADQRMQWNVATLAVIKDQWKCICKTRLHVYICRSHEQFAQDNCNGRSHAGTLFCAYHPAAGSA